MPISTVVTSAAQLIAVLSHSHAGDAILLAPGSYASVEINGFQSKNAPGVSGPPAPVTITSEFNDAQAVLGDVTVASSSGLTFSNLIDTTASLSGGSASPNYTRNFKVLSSSQINLVGLSISGSPLGTPSTDPEGLFIQKSNRISITDSSFAYLQDGIQQVGNDNVTISSNTFNYIDTDAIDGGGTSNIVISENTFSSGHRDASNLLHPDSVQFWTTGFTSSAKNIVVTDNTIERGIGNAIQGIFISDQVGDLPYYNINISGNHISGEEYNGIYVQNIRSSIISDNVVNSYPDYQSAIKVLDSVGVDVYGNYADSYEYMNDMSVRSSDNTVTKTSSAPLIPVSDFDESGLPFVDLPTGPLMSVPEPSTWILMILGYGSLGLAGRYRRRVVAAKN